MATKRNRSTLPIKSVWDEEQVLAIPRMKRLHALKIWKYLITHSAIKSLADVPYAKLSIPQNVERILTEEYQLTSCKIVEACNSGKEDTTKLLIELQDGHRIEAVVIQHPGHATVCVSSQIGCKMGCKFCATGTMGIIGDLTAAEILEQLYHANHFAKIRNVVFMGMGEPLQNFENVKSAVLFIVDTKRFSLSPSHITVSTVGVVKNMYRLTEECPGVCLALSLHAPTQDVRIKIVPTASAYKIEQLMDAIDNHINANRPDTRRYKKSMAGGCMLEYILIKNVNDRPEHAHLLGKLLAPRRKGVYLNLIPYNPTDVTEEFDPPTMEDQNVFLNILISEPYNIWTRIRKQMGDDVAGACGQLVVSRKDTSTGDIEDLMSNSSSSSKKSGRSSGDKAKREKSGGQSKASDTSATTSEAVGKGGGVLSTVSTWVLQVWPFRLPSWASGSVVVGAAIAAVATVAWAVRTYAAVPLSPNTSK